MCRWDTKGRRERQSTLVHCLNTGHLIPVLTIQGEGSNREILRGHIRKPEQEKTVDIRLTSFPFSGSSTVMVYLPLDDTSLDPETY